MRRLAGKTALVTGAARGIGKATVERFVAEGACVIALDRDSETAFEGQGPTHFVRADVTDSEAMEAAAALAGKQGRLDICVANAGVLVLEDFLESRVATWHTVLGINTVGVATTFRAAASRMTADGGGGRLLATASVAGLRGDPGSAAYCASKAAVVSVVETLAVELARYRITVNAVAPGEIDTRMNAQAMEERATQQGRSAEQVRLDAVAQHVPAGRMGTPNEVAALFAFLASDEASYITGETVRIDGGWCLL